MSKQSLVKERTIFNIWKKNKKTKNKKQKQNKTDTLFSDSTKECIGQKKKKKKKKKKNEISLLTGPGKSSFRIFKKVCYIVCIRYIVKM